MRKYFFTGIICLVIVLTGIFVSSKSLAQSIPGVQQWFLNVAGNYLYPLKSNVAIRVPSLANKSCLGTDSNGTFGTGTCGSGSSATTTINGFSGPAFTFGTGTPDTNIGLLITGSGSTITFQPTFSGQLSVSRGGTGTNTLASLTVGTGLSISGGQNVLIGTSTSISLGANVVTTLATGTAGNIFNGSIGSNTLTLNLPFASTVNTGQLQASDFTNFNNKVSATRAINTIAPITGGGDLSADRTIACPTCSTFAYGSTTYFTLWNTQAGANITITTTTNPTIAVVASPTFTNLTLTGTLGVTGTSTLATTTITNLTVTGTSTLSKLTVGGNPITGTNTGDVTLAGENYLSISGQQITANAVNLGGSNVTGVLTMGKGGTGTSTLPTVQGQFLSYDGSNYRPTNFVAGSNITITTTTPGQVTITNSAVTGLTSLNGATGPALTLATGTAGNIFNLASSSNAFTLNLPFSSITNTGQLSAADWLNFNNKLSGSLTSGQVVYATGASTTASSGNFLWNNGGSTLTVTGSTTISNLLTVGGTLGVTGTSTLATTTINGTLTVTNLGNCNGSQFAQYTAGVFGCGTPSGSSGGTWTIINGGQYNGSVTASTSDVVLIGTTTPTTASLYVTGTSTQATRDLLRVASSSGQSMVSVAANNNILFQNEVLPTLSNQKFFEVVGSQAGGVARIVRDVGAAPLTNQVFGTYDVTAYSSTSTIDWPDLTGPAQTFSIATGTMQNVVGDITAVRSVNDTSGKITIRPYLSGSPQGNLALNSDVNSASIYMQGISGGATILSVASSTANVLFGVQGNGQVTVGSTSPTAMLTVQGTGTLPSLDLFDVASSTGFGMLSYSSAGILKLKNPLSTSNSIFEVDQTFGVSQVAVLKVNANTTPDVQINNPNGTSGFGLDVTTSQNLTGTSGTSGSYESQSTVNPSSGTLVYNGLLFADIINQTGTSNGVTRDILISPTLTKSYDWRSLEVAAYTDNLANLYASSTQYNVLLNAQSYASSSAANITATITNASVLTITGAPIATASTTITSSTALSILGGSVRTSPATTTFAQGLWVAAPTGATNNYAALFNGGNVGIGTATPIGILHIQGTGSLPTTSALLVTSSTGVTVFQVSATGTVQQSDKGCANGLTSDANGFITGCLVSDQRMKENVEPLNSENIINELQPVLFDYIDNRDGHQSAGFIAQEVAKVAPQCEVPAGILPTGGQAYGVDSNCLLAYVVSDLQHNKNNAASLESHSDLNKWLIGLFGIFGIYIIYNEVQKRRKP